MWPFTWIRAVETQVVLDVMGPVGGCRVLELGCGDGHYARLLSAQGASVVGVDRSRELLRALEGTAVEVVVGDAREVALPGRFSRVLLAGLMEFLPDPERALANAAAHAEADARAVVLLPRSGVGGRLYQAWHRTQGRRVHTFSSGALTRLSGASGWRVAAARPAGPLAWVAALERQP